MMSPEPLHDVLAHIDAHLDEDLSLARLSRVARASTFHFHRQFKARFGVAVHSYVKLARLRRAAYQLAFRRRLRVVDIALASGYESPEAFARAWKRLVGCTPTEFRRAPDWGAWNALNRSLFAVRERDAATPGQPFVVIKELPPVRVAALELRGRPLRVGEALQRFIAWRIEQRLTPSRSATYNVFHDPEGQTELDLCAAMTRPVPPNELGIVAKEIPGGLWALVRHIGTNGSLFDAAHWLHRVWLPQSGHTLRAAPLVIRRLSLFPDVPEHEAESEILLPLAHSACSERRASAAPSGPARGSGINTKEEKGTKDTKENI